MTATTASGGYDVPESDRTHTRSVRRTYTEAKNGFKTSEFSMMLIAVAAVLIATYVDDDDSLTTNDGWRYAAWIAVAYIVSRGLAKLGTREPYNEHDNV